MDRKPIFTAVRQLRGGKPFTLDEVHQLDHAIDEAFGVAPVLAPITVKVLATPQAFFNRMRGSDVLGPTLTETEVSGCNAIMGVTGACHWGRGWTAYALATAYHETAGTMQPIREYGRGKGRAYGKAGKHGQSQYGRGYVQLTWDANYEKADSALGLNGQLLANFDRALDPPIAAAILSRGMQEGWFTSRKLGDYMGIDADGTREAFTKCRAIINGKDKDTLIANYAILFQSALKEGGWA